MGDLNRRLLVGRTLLVYQEHAGVQLNRPNNVNVIASGKVTYFCLAKINLPMSCRGMFLWAHLTLGLLEKGTSALSVSPCLDWRIVNRGHSRT